MLSLYTHERMYVCVSQSYNIMYVYHEKTGHTYVNNLIGVWHNNLCRQSRDLVDFYYAIFQCFNK